MIWMIKKIYIYVISMILLNGLVGSISYLCFRKIRQQLERKGLISMCITVLRGAVLSFLMPIVIVLIYFIYYVYEEDYTMFALSPLVGWVFFVVGIIWTIGFLKAILKTIRIQAQMNQLRKRACVCSRSILDCKNQWKEEVGVRRNVEIKTVYGLAVPIICGFLKPMILLPEREYNKEELKTVMARGLQASLVGQVLVEESILGWEELELEVVRDAEGNMITVCFIENIDPLGVHTGDSFCSAPMLTISEECQQRLQEQAYKIVDSVQVIGGTNVQFAHDPVTDRIIVIEINPRTSRSSALASKATGFPIALVSAMLAAGLTLKDIPCGKYGTLDKYVPDGDYVVIKFARWAFEKFKGVEDKLGTQMRAVGEVMSIGKTYKEAFQKAIRSLETGRYGLGHANNFDTLTKEELLKKLVTPSSERHFIMYEALRKGATVDEIFELTKVKTYFIEQMKELVEEEEKLLACKGNMPSDEMLTSAKKDGFSDKYLSQLLEIPEEDIVVHYMGEPTETRHIIMRSEEAVISPSWSIHSASATHAYTFIWGMVGENQDFDDMDGIANQDIM